MQRKTVSFAVLVIVVHLKALLVKGYSDGSIPLSRCDNMTPLHGSQPQSPDINPYSLLVPFETYLPDKNVELTLKGGNLFSPEPFLGYYVQGRTFIGEQPIGKFIVSNFNLTQIHSCSNNVTGALGVDNTISHAGHWGSNSEATLAVNWIAPFSNSDLYFRATFVQSFDIFWVGTSSLTMSPLHQMNFTECCEKESQISSSIKSVCADLEAQGLAHSSTIQTNLEQISDESELQGLFLALRCLHWSNSSSPDKRSRLPDCCSAGGVSEQCLIFCNGETYATWDAHQSFFQSFQNCSLNNKALLLCLLDPHGNQVLSTTNSPFPEIFTDNYSPTEDYDDVFTTANPSGCEGFGPSASNCSCDSGLTSDGFLCIDIDECVDDPCVSNADCTNTFGSFFCSCSAGYVQDETTCIDIDECLMGICSFGGSCINTPGSFSCFCFFGFTGNGINCTDLNECEEDSCDSHAVCTNTPGSISCSCSEGFSGDGTHCEDVDECESDPCHPNASCINSPGSFVCSCSHGFDGSGSDCDASEATTALDVSTTLRPVIQDNSLFYLIVSTINFTPTSSMQELSLNEELELNLLAPALRTLSGYQRVRFVNGTIGSFIITSEAEFVATNTGNGLLIPSLSMIKNSLEERGRSLNYNIPGPTSSVISVDVDPNFEVTRQAINGLCDEGTGCPTPPTGYSSSCVEVGPSSVYCFCMQADVEVDCATIQPPAGGESLSVGAIVGIVIGVIVLLPVLTVVLVWCCKRRKDNKDKDTTKPPEYVGYVDPMSLNTKKTDGIQTEDVDAVYMEIQPREDSLYTKDGEYLDMETMFQNSKNEVDKAVEPQKQRVVVKEENGYENPMEQPPILPGNHPARVEPNAYVNSGGKEENKLLHPENTKDKPCLIAEENGDGYLVSTQDIVLEGRKEVCQVTIHEDQPYYSPNANYETIVDQNKECPSNTLEKDGKKEDTPPFPGNTKDEPNLLAEEHGDGYVASMKDGVLESMELEDKQIATREPGNTFDDYAEPDNAKKEGTKEASEVVTHENQPSEPSSANYENVTTVYQDKESPLKSPEKDCVAEENNSSVASDLPKLIRGDDTVVIEIAGVATDAPREETSESMQQISM